MRTGSVGPSQQAMAYTFAAWSRVRRSKQPAAYAPKVLLNQHLLEHPSPDGLSRHASRVIAAGTAGAALSPGSAFQLVPGGMVAGDG